MVRLGFAPGPRSHGDVLRDYAAEAERLDQLEEREWVKRAEEQLAVRTERVARSWSVSWRPNGRGTPGWNPIPRRRRRLGSETSPRRADGLPRSAYERLYWR